MNNTDLTYIMKEIERPFILCIHFRTIGVSSLEIVIDKHTKYELYTDDTFEIWGKAYSLDRTNLRRVSMYGIDYKTRSVIRDKVFFKM